MRFDFYAGLILCPRVATFEVRDQLAAAVGGETYRGGRRRAYRETWDYSINGHVIGWVARHVPLGATYFEFHGSGTPVAVQALRRLWPEEHTVSRLDSCIDLDQPGGFERLRDRIDRAAGARVSQDAVAISRRVPGGARTLLYGSQHSVARVRLYEAGLMTARLRLNQPNWVRLELQVRPKSRDKRLLATLGPEEAWGIATWTKHVAEAVGTVGVARLPIQKSEKRDSLMWFAVQYRRALVRLRDGHGGWEGLGGAIEDAWAELDRNRAIRMPGAPTC